MANVPTRILVVEDERIVAEDLAEMLGSLGYAIAGIATTGESAVELARQQTPDLILIDVRLGDGLDGIAAVTQIRAARDVPVIYLTAHADDETLRRATETQPFGYLGKPLRQADLRSAIEIAVHKHRSDSAMRARENWLENAYEELEMFSYAVAHDLRAPLRGIEGFSRALAEDHAHLLPPDGIASLNRVRNAAQRMSQLIDDLLRLSQTANAPLERRVFDLSPVALAVIEGLRAMTPAREVVIDVEPHLYVDGDPSLVRIVLENLLGNAWKFTRFAPKAAIQVGRHSAGQHAVFVRDNGAGFDVRTAERLFGAFQRFHHPAEFDGNGVGLAIVQRIINRHGGRIWAESSVGRGATFSFVL